MLTKEEREKYESLQKYVKALPDQHLTIKQEKKLYAERMERRKEMQAKATERVRKEEKRIWVNHLYKYMPASEYTEQIEQKELDFFNL